MDYAFQFVINNHGIDTEEDYPYQGREHTCNKEKVLVFQFLKSFTLVKKFRVCSITSVLISVVICYS